MSWKGAGEGGGDDRLSDIHLSQVVRSELIITNKLGGCKPELGVSEWYIPGVTVSEDIPFTLANGVNKNRTGAICVEKPLQEKWGDPRVGAGDTLAVSR